MNSFNDPLLYIDGPPVFHLPPGVKVEVPLEVQNEAQKAVQKEIQKDVPKKEQEQSTSIYEMSTTTSGKTLEVLEKLRFLARPFQRKVYRPLVFHIEGGLYVPGEVEKVDEEFVTFVVGDSDKITYRIDQIQKIVWRGVEMK